MPCLSERKVRMDKKKTLESSKKAVSLFFRIRLGYKIYVSFITGILSGIEIYKIIYAISEDKMFSWALAILAGTIITVTMLLILKLMRICIAKLKMIGKKTVFEI